MFVPSAVMKTKRFKMTISYHGGGFVGWQRQKTGLSIQEVIEQVLEKIEGVKVPIYAAGRTDSGVHALGQVCHTELKRNYPAEKYQLAINANLKPHAIAVIEMEPVAMDFHARFSAKQRDYCYRLLNRPAPPVLERGLVWHQPRPLDDNAMAKAAHYLLGQHDFSSFRASMCQAHSPIKTLNLAEVKKKGDEIELHFSARSFLHHQVRNMVGSLVDIGLGKIPPEAIKKILAAKNRNAAGITAPAFGLCLMAVKY